MKVVNFCNVNNANTAVHWMIDRRNWWARGVVLNAGPVYRSPPNPYVLH